MHLRHPAIVAAHAHVASIQMQDDFIARLQRNNMFGLRQVADRIMQGIEMQVVQCR